MYHDGARELQDRFDTRRLADRLEDVKVHATITAADRAFIERMDMFFLATADAEGRPQCSYKGGDPGFVAVLDEHTIAFPNYDGNGMYLSIGNLRVNPTWGCCSSISAAGRRGACASTASPRSSRATRCSPASPAPSSWCASARSQVFPNCPRYIHRMQLVERSPFVPRPAEDTPVPDWKRADWARDALPADDPARG